MTFSDAAQIGIALTGAVAVFLTQSRRFERRRWACIVGLIGQPFWFFAAIEAGQWGVFAVSVLYLLGWLRGLWTYWLSPERER
jgi:hypothetical protein